MNKTTIIDGVGKVNLTKLAKDLGVSRPTLYKMTETDGLEYWVLQNEKQNLLNFLSLHNRFSPQELESVLEWLNDNGFLSKKGLQFRTKFWETLIKE